MQLPEFRLEAYFTKWEFRARHHMTASDAETMPLGALLALADDAERAAWDALHLGYTPTWGDPALRDAIAATYDGLTRDEVICFAGAQEGIFCAMHAVLDAGDHAIVVVPNYQSLESLPRAICGDAVTGIALRADDGWRLDLDELARAFRPNTKLVAVNVPHNPTGAVPTHDEFARLIALCAERGVVLLCDEVYRGIERDPQRTLPQAAERYERALSLNVLSKAYGLPGLRVGWIASRDRALLARMEKMKHYLSICNAGPSEMLARIALRNRETLLARTRERCRDNLGALGAFFAAFADRYDWSEPVGGATGYPRYLGSDGVEEHCRRLIEEAGVLLLPASLFRSELAPAPTDRFRVGYGRAGIERGLEAWRAFLARG